MSKYQAYPEYKDSGNRLLGEIPKHWQLTRIKYVAEITPKKPRVDRQQMCSFIPMEKLKTNSIVLDEIRQIGDVYDGYTYFANNDILMAKVTPCFENKNIAIAKGLINQIGFGSSEIYPIRVNEKTNNRFLFYRLQEDGFMELAIGTMTGAGGLRRVPSETLTNYIYALPAYEEQEKIASFLDHETAKIDTLIDKQQQLIQLLKEKRQAVISHAVTKGLNPNAPMRDSGVEWLGEVPEHWEMTRAKFVSNIFIPQRNKPELNDAEGTAWVTMENMKTSYIENTSLYVSRNASKVAGSKKLKKDSVIASCVGNFGVAAINKVDVIINQQLQAFIPFAIKAEYLRELVAMSTVYFELVGTAATLTYVNQEGFENLPVLVPPANEQKKICIYLEAENMKFENLIDKAQSAIQLMQERRTALISAAVTGKIDVSHWQVPAPMQSKEAV